MERSRGVRSAEGGAAEQVGRAEADARSVRLWRRAATTLRVDGDHVPGWVTLDAVRPSDAHERGGVPRVLWYNDDLALALSRRRDPMPCFSRNTDADELWLALVGEGTCETELGPLRLRAGDLVVIPRGITFRLVPESPDPLLLQLESRAAVCTPIDVAADRIEIPTPTPSPEAGVGAVRGPDGYEIRVKRAGQFTSFHQREHPLAVEGWSGNLVPFRCGLAPLPPGPGGEPLPLLEATGWRLVGLGGDAGGETPAVQRDVDRDVVVMPTGQAAAWLWAPAGAPRPLPQQPAPPRTPAIAIEALRPLVVTPDVRRALRPLAASGAGSQRRA